jgi:hypothetical protein
MSSCDIPDLIPPEGNSEQERWQSEQEDKLLFAARMQKILQQIGVDQGLANGLAGGVGGKQGGSGHKGGRPASDNAPPHLEQKGDGRPVTSTSN